MNTFGNNTFKLRKLRQILREIIGPRFKEIAYEFALIVLTGSINLSVEPITPTFFTIFLIPQMPLFKGLGLPFSHFLFHQPSSYP